MTMKYVFSTDALTNILYKLKVVKATSVSHQLALMELEMVRIGAIL